jgi:hypothetical protein
MALLTSSSEAESEREAQTEAVQVEGYAEQQGSPLLGQGGTAGGTRRELALGCRGDGLDQRPLAIALSGEIGPHLGAHAVEAPYSLATLGRDDAVRANDLEDEGVVQVTVELPIRQDAADGDLLAGVVEQRPKGSPIIGRPRLGDLRQDQAPGRVDYNHPFQPVPPSEPVPSECGRLLCLG